jgi:ComF family protein
MWVHLKNNEIKKRICCFLQYIKQKIGCASFPFICIFCLEKADQALDLCQDCAQYLPWLKQTCRSCAIPLLNPAHTICGRCLKQPFPFYKVCILFSYTTVLQRLIIGLKFHGHLLYAEILGTLLAENVKIRYQGEDWPQILIPVPLHAQRLGERGFNQALELARPLHRILKIGIDNKSCVRIRPTLAQSSLSASQRVANLKNAFRVKLTGKYEHVALLDDVMTTGQTVTELGRLLYQIGVKRIDVWCCARTHLEPINLI